LIDYEEAFQIEKALLKEKGLVRQHLDSYNEFVEKGLQEVIDESGEIEIEVPEGTYKVKFGRIFIVREIENDVVYGPYITEVDGTRHETYPMEARLRNLTYAMPLSVEMTPIMDGKETEKELVYIGDLPCLLKSKYCLLSELSGEELVRQGEDPLDPGGYFLINGSERVIVAIEDLAQNRILVDIDSRGVNPVYQAKVFSTTVGFRARIELRMKADGSMHVSVPGAPSEIPLVILMRALGLESDKEIAETVSPDTNLHSELEASFETTGDIDSVEDALLYIGNRVAHGQVKSYRLQKTGTILDRNFLPHVGRTLDQRKDKAYFLGEMASRVIELKLGRRKPDDKDQCLDRRQARNSLR
jgi:DNA-directed RNA polymerase subunit B